MTCGIDHNLVSSVGNIYSKRFNQKEDFIRNVTWEVLCKKFFQKFIPEDSVVVDLAAGEGVFVKNIKAKERIAIDIDPAVSALQSEGITVIQASALDIAKVLNKKVDVIFISNFLEHLSNKHIVLDLLKQCHECLSEKGKIIILQPNIRYVKAAYWDYIDHNIALTDQSVIEALSVTGFYPIYFLKRFLPYTAKSTLGNILGEKTARIFINLYLKFPIVWKIFGGQCFVVAAKNQENK